MTLKLTDELCDAVDSENGGPMEVAGSGKNYVVMTADMYRELIGIGTDDEFHSSVAAVTRGMQEVQAGRTRPLRDVLDGLGRPQ